MKKIFSRSLAAALCAGYGRRGNRRAWRLRHAAHDGDSGRAGRDCIQQGGLGYLRAAGKPDCAAFIASIFKLSIFRANFVQFFLLS